MAGRLLWSHEGAAVPSPRNTSCLVTASVRLGGGRLFPGLPPCRRVVPHVPVPRSDNLVNLRAAAGTCSCSPTLPAGSGHGVLQCLCRCRAVPGTAVWCCLSWLLSPPPPPPPARLSEVQVQRAWLSLLEPSESQGKCQYSVQVTRQLSSC